MKLRGTDTPKYDKETMMARARQAAETYKLSKITTVTEKTTVTKEIVEYAAQTNEEPQILTPAPCSICHGAGYLRSNVPFGHPDFGKPLACECKIAEQKEIHQQTLVANSGILGMKLYEDASFDTFDLVEGVSEAFAAALRYSQRPQGWLVLLGPNGCGKTHLEVAIATKRVEMGDTVMIQTAPSLLASLRSAFNPLVEITYDDKFREMQQVDMLIVDDYGAHNSTAWADEKFFELLNYRYNNKLPTVISSNNIDLGGIDPRIRSRLGDVGLVKRVKMDKARDYRPVNDGSNIVEGN